NLMARASFQWSIGVLPLALACGADPGPAVTEQRHPLADAAQTSELLGFSLQEVMPTGAHVASLTWQENKPGIEFSPAQVSTELRWSLELPAAPSIDEIDVECDRERFITNLDSLCEDRLEASLLLHLESADGALSEDIPVTLEAQSLSDVHWNNRELDFADF